MTDETRQTLAFAIEALRREANAKREAHDNMAAIRYLHEAQRIEWIMEHNSPA